MLKWAREHGCPSDATTCACAARGGQLQVLQWAREHQCPWDQWTCMYAAQFWLLPRSIEMLRWAREHGAPWTAATRDLAATKGYTDDLPLSL